MNRSILLSLLVVSAAACGQATPEATGTPPAEGASEALPPVMASSTTIAERNLVDPFPRSAPVELAPAGAYEVIDLQKVDVEALPPGTYRYRLEYQADWPEECLEEFVVVEPFTADRAPTPLSDEERANIDPGAAERFLEESRAAMDQRIELQRPICESFWEKTPGATDKPLVEPVDTGLPPSTTLPDR